MDFSKISTGSPLAAAADRATTRSQKAKSTWFVFLSSKPKKATHLVYCEKNSITNNLLFGQKNIYKQKREMTVDSFFVIKNFSSQSFQLEKSYIIIF